MRWRRLRGISSQLDIIRAAERLFAEKGVDGATLLEIAQAAGQKNRSAVHYHFENRRGLIEAILERHSGPVQESWIEPLAMLERENMITLPRLIALIVSSLTKRAHDPDGGSLYINIARQLLVHPRIPLMETKMVHSAGALKMGEAITACITVPPEFAVLWPMRMAHMLFHSIGDFQTHGPPTLPREVFEKDLVRSIVGVFVVEE